MSNVIIYKVYHDLKLLETFDCPKDGMRRIYNTSKHIWGKYFNEASIFFDEELDINSEYIGLEHYRRSFTGVTNSYIEDKLKNGGCLVYTYIQLLCGTYCKNYLETPMCNMSTISNQIKNYLHQNKLYRELFAFNSNYLLILRSMFIMRTSDFIKMREFIINVKNYLFEVNNIQSPEDIIELSKDWNPELFVFRGKHRLFAFIFEYLVDVWIRSHIHNIFLYQYNKDGIPEMKFDRLVLDIHITDHCNLNCASCLHMAPLASEQFLDVKEYENSLKLIPTKILNGFVLISLLGGEPLLHPEITEIIKITRKYFINNQIILFTNGILLPKMKDSFFLSCKDNNIFILISHYPNKNIDYNKLEQIVTSKKVSILNKYLNDDRGVNFVKIGLDINGKLNATELYTHCRTNFYHVCLLLIGTKIFSCPYAGYIKNFNNYFNTNIYSNDYLDLSKISLFNEVLDWLYFPKDICKHCVITNTTKIPWRISKRNINEYVI